MQIETAEGAAHNRTIGLLTGTFLVIANMIGAGVFITTGSLLSGIGSGTGVLAAWFAGGLIAMCGALCYAELGAALPRNGGEYYFLSRAFHPLVGFLAGWASAIAGFCAPLAIVAWAFGSHLHELVPQVDRKLAAVTLIVTCSVLHAMNVRGGHVFQNLFTAIKVALILVFVAAGLAVCQPSRIVSESGPTLVESVFSSGFAVGMVLVYFAYSGWNASAYVAGEFRRPERDLPLSIVLGTAIVTSLYMALNVVFLSSAPAQVLIDARTDEISTLGHTAAAHLFGPEAGRAMSLLIVLGLVSSAGAFLVAGSRMLEAMGERHPGLGWLAVRTTGGGPITAIALQAAPAIVMLHASKAELLLNWVGLTLSVFSALTVLALFVLRIREPDLPRPYRTWGYPVTPIVYLILQVWVIVQVMIWNPWTSLASTGLLALGAIVYYAVGVRTTKPVVDPTASAVEIPPRP